MGHTRSCLYSVKVLTCVFSHLCLKGRGVVGLNFICYDVSSQSLEVLEEVYIVI